MLQVSWGVLQPSPDNMWVSHWPQWRAWIYPPPPPLYLKCFHSTMTLTVKSYPTVPASLVFQSIPSTPSAYSPHPSPPPPPPYSPSHINKAVVSSARWQMDSVRKPLHHTHQLFVYAKLSWCPWIEYLESLTSSITFAPSAGCVRYI